MTYDERNLPLTVTRAGVTTSNRYDDAGQPIARLVGNLDKCPQTAWSLVIVIMNCHAHHRRSSGHSFAVLALSGAAARLRITIAQPAEIFP